MRSHSFSARASAQTVLLAIAALALPVAAQEQAERDAVQLVDGKAVTGLIQSEDFGGLSIKVQGKVEVYAWDQVRSTTYRDAERLVQAEQDFDAGNLDAAEQGLQQVVDGSKGRPVVRQHALYVLALLKERERDAAGAAAAWHKLVEDYPRGRHLGTAATALVNLRVIARDFDGAAKELAQFTPRATDVPELKPRLALLKAELLEAQARLADAIADFEALGAAAGIGASLKAEAELGKARCLVAQKKPADAEGLLRRIVEQALPSHIHSEGWNTLADVLLEQGRSNRDAEKLLEALFAYLRSSVLYGPLPGQPTREYERALAGSARCFQLIAEVEKSEERRQLYQQRARERADLLARDFPDSEFRSQP